ncbi:hypothetical protein EDB89DRAFT_1917374 [Lactarius sanguifluus]|nr:hypothetical protein EDB89DRAFT_1917374 [Lactarius sanguifluus]
MAAESARGLEVEGIEGALPLSCRDIRGHPNRRLASHSHRSLRRLIAVELSDPETLVEETALLHEPISSATTTTTTTAPPKRNKKGKRKAKGKCKATAQTLLEDDIAPFRMPTTNGVNSKVMLVGKMLTVRDIHPTREANAWMMEELSGQHPSTRDRENSHPLHLCCPLYTPTCPPSHRYLDRYTVSSVALVASIGVVGVVETGRLGAEHHEDPERRRKSGEDKSIAEIRIGKKDDDADVQACRGFTLESAPESQIAEKSRDLTTLAHPSISAPIPLIGFPSFAPFVSGKLHVVATCVATSAILHSFFRTFASP